MKNTSSGIYVTDGNSEELFLWKIDLFDTSVSENKLKSTPQTYPKYYHDPSRDVCLTKCWGARLKHACAMSQISFNLRKDVKRQQEPVLTYHTSDIVFILGAFNLVLGISSIDDFLKS